MLKKSAFSEGSKKTEPNTFLLFLLGMLLEQGLNQSHVIRVA